MQKIEEVRVSKECEERPRKASVGKRSVRKMSVREIKIQMKKALKGKELIV